MILQVGNRALWSYRWEWTFFNKKNPWYPLCNGFPQIHQEIFSMRFHCFLLYKKIATFHWNGTHGWILNFSLQRVVLWVALIHLVIEQRTCIIIVAPVYALMLIRISLIPRSRAYKYWPRSRVLEPGLIRLFFHLKQCFSLTDSSSIPPNHPDSSKIQTSEQAQSLGWIFYFNFST